MAKNEWEVVSSVKNIIINKKEVSAICNDVHQTWNLSKFMYKNTLYIIIL